MPRAAEMLTNPAETRSGRRGAKAPSDAFGRRRCRSGSGWARIMQTSGTAEGSFRRDACGSVWQSGSREIRRMSIYVTLEDTASQKIHDREGQGHGVDRQPLCPAALDRCGRSGTGSGGKLLGLRARARARNPRPLAPRGPSSQLTRRSSRRPQEHPGSAGRGHHDICALRPWPLTSAPLLPSQIPDGRPGACVQPVSHALAV